MYFCPVALKKPSSQPTLKKSKDQNPGRSNATLISPIDSYDWFCLAEVLVCLALCAVPRVDFTWAASAWLHSQVLLPPQLLK
jgi:hypothetical protein